MTTISDQNQNDYLARIDQAIAGSQGLQDWLLWRSSQDSKQPAGQIKLLIESLKGGVPSKEWISNPKLAPLLPLVLRSVSKPDDLSNLEPWYQLLQERPLGVWDILRRYYYPITIAIAAMVVVYYFSLAIIPAFRSMFEDYELRLPDATKLVFGIANFVVNFTVLAIGQILLGIAGMIGLIKLMGYLLDRFEKWSLVRFLRRGTKKSLGSMARWSGTLSELLHIGMPADQAIATAGLASRRPWLKEQSLQLASASKLDPRRLWSSYPQARQFSASSIAALDLHQQGEPGASVLREIANSYALRWVSRESVSYNWLGPIVMLFVAKMVLFLILALFLPLISLITSLSG